MSKIEIDIPKDMEKALDDAFPGEDKATVLLRLAQTAIARSSVMASGMTAVRPKKSLIEMASEIRARMPSISQQDIRRIREEGRH